MTYQEILDHFGDGKLTQAAKALGLPITTVNKWRVTGVPFGRQCQIQIETGGKLRATEPKRARRLPA